MSLGFRIYLGAMALLLLVVIVHTLSPRVRAPQPGAAQTAIPATEAGSQLIDLSLPSAEVTVSATQTATTQPTSTATALPATTTPQPTEPAAEPLSTRFRAQEDDFVTRITPGMYHIYRETDDPLKINILLFDLTAPEFDLKTGLGDGWLSGRARTSYMVAQNGAIAGVNGDLFSATGIPQGLTIVDSEVAMAPKHRATFAWTKDREPFIGYFTEAWTWQADVVAPNGEITPMYQLNWYCPPNLICLFNDFAGAVPLRSGDVKVLVSPRGRVSNIVGEQWIEIPPRFQVLQGTGEGARWLLNNLEIGDKVEMNIYTDPPLEDFAQAISGGPLLIENGEFVEDCFCTLRDCSLVDETGLLCEDFTYDWKESHYLWVRMPRTGVAFDKEKQTLIVAVVDGYQLGYSRGITQEEFADLLQEFGAYMAMELDGGGSTTMVIGDEIANQPSDDTGERYVANALLFFWDSPLQERLNNEVDQSFPSSAQGLP